MTVDFGIGFIPLPKAVEDGKKTEGLSGHSRRFFLLQVGGMNNVMKGSLDFDKTAGGRLLKRGFGLSGFFSLKSKTRIGEATPWI